MMVAKYTLEGNSFRAEKLRLWSEAPFTPTGPAGTIPNRDFDLHPDGQRFVLAKAGESERETRPDKITFVLNFFDELRRVAATKR